MTGYRGEWYGISCIVINRLKNTLKNDSEHPTDDWLDIIDIHWL